MRKTEDACAPPHLLIAWFIFLVINFLWPMPGSATDQGPSARCVEIDAEQKCKLYGVSIIDLIANRERYDGLRIQLIGYLHLTFEGNAVYLSREDYEHAIKKNGLWVRIEQARLPELSRLSDHYVLIEGTFNAKQYGHRGSFSGAIENITRLEVWK